MTKTINSSVPEDASVSLFREYLRIRTVQPYPDYKASTAFLKREAAIIGLDFCFYELETGKPIVILTWLGQETNLPSILLNSHTDVVPVFPTEWKYDPFEAVKDDKGDIYARGSQDMKCVGIQHLEAVRRLKNNMGIKFKRTIHISFVPDEEIGGIFGMKKFVETDAFKALNVGFALDEGLASPTNIIPVFYGERNVLWLNVRCPGNPGHGSRFIPNTAAEKAVKFMNKLLQFREEEFLRLNSNPELTLGDVCSVNITKMKGGVQCNVVPDEFVITFDIRVTPTVDLVTFQAKLIKWAEEAGSGLELEYEFMFIDQTLTCVDSDDAWFSAFSRATDLHGFKIKPQIFSAGTDSRYIRMKGIPALGFSPMPNTPVLLHDHNEFLNQDVFLKGIDIFCDIIKNIASV